MQPATLLYTILGIIFIACVYSIWKAWKQITKSPDLKPQHPKPHCPILQFYNADYDNIVEQIRTARGASHLDLIKESIHLFKKKYTPYQSQFILHSHWKELLILWKEKNNKFVIKVQLTPEQKN